MQEEQTETSSTDLPSIDHVLQDVRDGLGVGVRSCGLNSIQLGLLFARDFVHRLVAGYLGLVLYLSYLESTRPFDYEAAEKETENSENDGDDAGHIT